MTSNIVVASNRGPVSWHVAEDGSLAASRGSGGLVTALGGALQREDGTWISVALSEGDRAVAADHGGNPFDVEVEGSSYRLRLLDVADRFDGYYNEVSNRFLWFTVHELWSAPYEPTGLGWREPWFEGYLPVNDAVGDAVAAASGSTAEVFLQDYHLCVAPSRVRAARPDLPLLQYLHTPWAQPEYLRMLPDVVVAGVLRGLLAADVVAFSAPEWCEAFRRCATDLVGAKRDGDALWLDGRRTVVADFVLGVDPEDLRRTADHPDVARAGEQLDAEIDGRQLVLRVDRTDLSKNILRGLHAYELLLERHPEHRGRVWHYAHLNPSRQDVAEYRAYLDACRAATARIADRFGEDAVSVFIGDDYPRAIAALQRSDVLLTNPVMDGTNLVAKEGSVLNQRDGVVVLSRNAGAATVLADAALVVNPYDVEGQAEALHRALAMDGEERRARARRLADAACVGAPEEWFAAQRRLLRRVVADGADA